MSKLMCECGEELSTVMYPNEIEGGLLTLSEMDMLFDDDDDEDYIEAGRLNSLLRDVWECHKCGRLAISLPKKSDRHVKWYKPEDGKPGKLMAFTDK